MYIYVNNKLQKSVEMPVYLPFTIYQKVNLQQSMQVLGIPKNQWILDFTDFHIDIKK